MSYGRSSVKRLYLLFIFFIWIAEAKPPQIGPRDVKIKIEEILKAHASFKQLTPEIIKRAFQNFLEELDPSKTYFLIPEIEPWLNPSQAMIQKALNGFQ